VSRCQKRTSVTSWCKEKLTEADTLTIRLGATPSGLSAHLHHPIFLQVGCPSCRPTNSVKVLKVTRMIANIQKIHYQMLVSYLLQTQVILACQWQCSDMYAAEERLKWVTGIMDSGSHGHLAVYLVLASMYMMTVWVKPGPYFTDNECICHPPAHTQSFYLVVYDRQKRPRANVHDSRWTQQCLPDQQQNKLLGWLVMI